MQSRLIPFLVLAGVGLLVLFLLKFGAGKQLVVSNNPAPPAKVVSPAVSRDPGKGPNLDSAAFEEQLPGAAIAAALNGEANPSKLSPSELAKYIQSNRSNSFSLVAAYETSRDQEYIKLAAKLHPDDPLVQSKILLHNVFPEERQKWIDAFKKSAPDNSLGNLLLARELMDKGDVTGALNEIAAANGKKLNDYYRETATGLQEAYLDAGRSITEAKMVGSAEVLLPHLAQFKKTASELSTHAATQAERGDIESQKTMLSGAFSIASQMRNSGERGVLITELVGIAIENNVLKTWPKGEPMPFLKVTPEEQLRLNGEFRQETRRNTSLMDTWMRQAPEEEIIAYHDRMMQYGESQALSWLRNKHPELTPPPIERPARPAPTERGR